MPVSSAQPRVVVVGDVINDILVKPAGPVVRGSDTVSEIKASPGGSAASQAAWMAHLGLDVTFAARCGARDASFHRSSLSAYGVRPVLFADPDAETGSIVIMVSPDGERTMFTDRGANLRLRASDVPVSLLDGAAVLHLTGYTFFTPGLRSVALGLMAGARARGVTVTVDPGSAAFLAELPAGEFLAWTAGAALCFPNLDEAAALVPRGDPASLAASLAKHYGAVVLKLGGGGCLIARAGSEPVVVPASRLGSDLVDTTGAGDAFCAAFLSQWLSGSGELDDAARFAVQVAAEAVGRLGGRPPRP
ncbi:MAG TPA: sugar kinase, partial [Streptosporangiaceae bacterium]|nr:sugar kinase [Streptosporangiaceae bacterium]